MGTIMRDWESTEPNPDEEHLKAVWEEEIKDVQFIEPLPESLLLNALADNVQKLMKETEAKRLLEEKVEGLESELGRVKKFVALGRCAEKILLELSNPILHFPGNSRLLRGRCINTKECSKNMRRRIKKSLKRW